MSKMMLFGDKKIIRRNIERQAKCIANASTLMRNENIVDNNLKFSVQVDERIFLEEAEQDFRRILINTYALHYTQERTHTNPNRMHKFSGNTMLRSLQRKKSK